MSKLSRSDLFIKTDYASGTCIWRTKFAQLPVVAKAICEDGVLRTIRLNQTGGELRGRTSFGKRTLTGSLSFVPDSGYTACCVTLHFTLDMKG